MINNKEDLWFYLHEDMVRNLHVDRFSRWKYYIGIVFKDNGALAYRFLRRLRKLEYAKNVCKYKGLIGRLYYAYCLFWHKHFCFKYDIDIRPNVVGYGLYLPHIIGGGIICNAQSIGNYCAINVNVLLGNKGTDEIPTVGDYVDMTTGCKIIGKVKVGNNVTIGPNSVVVKDIPDKAVVVGIPARILKFKM